MLASLLTLAFTLLSVASAQSESSCQNCFIYPEPFGVDKDYSNDRLLPLGSKITISWYYAWPTDTHGLWLFQQNVNSGQLIDDKIPGQGRIDYHWTLDTDKDWENFPVFFFWVSPNISSTQSFSSHYFNLTKPVSPPSPSSTSSSTSSSSTSSSSTSSPTSSPTISPVSSPTGTALPVASSTNQQSGGLSSSASVGLGVGIGVGGLALLAAAGLFVFYRRKKQRNTSPPDYEPPVLGQGTQPNPSTAYTAYSPYRGGYEEAKVELPNQYPVEADSRTASSEAKTHVELPTTR